MEGCCSLRVVCIPARLGQGLCVLNFLYSTLLISGIDYYMRCEDFGVLRVYVLFDA